MVKKILSILIPILLFSYLGNAQSAFIYTSSADNGIQNWTSETTWTRDFPGLGWPPTTPGQPTTHTNLAEVRVNGYVEILSGGLTINGANPLITVIDTLYIRGNVTLASGASMLVEGAGLLVIDGNLTLNGSFEMANDGNVVVTGNLNVPNGFIENNENFYTFGSTTVNGGGEINGCDGYEGCDFSDFISSETDLQNDNEDLFNFVDEDGSLPIELKSFTASKSGENIALNWVTAKEENFSHFEIERSVDQKNWEQLGLVQGMGESMSDVHYDFTDRNVPFGVIYYRLNSVDIDASFEYSPVVKIEVGFEGKLAVSPNPVKDASDLKIQVPKDFRENLAYVGLFDLSGIKVQEFRDFNTDATLQVDQKLKSGMYILKVNHNGLQENIRVVIQ